MDNALGVSGIERVGNLDGEGQNRIAFHRAIPDVMLERHAVQELHDDERTPIVLADFVDRADVRVVQCRGSLGLALEAAERLRVLRHVVGKELERDKATKFGVLCFVNNTHPAAAELLDDSVMRDRLPDQLGGCAHVRKC